MKKSMSVLLSILLIICGLFAFGMSAGAQTYKSVTGKYNYTYAAEVLKLVNNERQNNGLKPLVMTQQLTDGAMIRAAETTVSFSHTRPNGEQCFTAFSWSRTAGENIACGQRTPAQVVSSWMNSSGHRGNILNSSFTTIGIGCFEYGNTCYWSQAFSGGNGTSYNPTGSKNVTVNVSLVSGVNSYADFALTSTANIETASSTSQKPTTSKQSSTTKKPSQTTKHNCNVYSRFRSYFYRYFNYK